VAEKCGACQGEEYAYPCPRCHGTGVEPPACGHGEGPCDPETTAAEEHAIWSHWMTYMFSKCEPAASGGLYVPAWAVDRWKRQAATKYAGLTEQEKQSDRDVVTEHHQSIADLRDRLAAAEDREQALQVELRASAAREHEAIQRARVMEEAGEEMSGLLEGAAHDYRCECVWCVKKRAVVEKWREVKR
jgi:hypothetical protein